EALDTAGWDRAEAVLASLPAQLAGAERMEEANAWRNPVDLVPLLEDAFAQLPAALSSGASVEGRVDRQALVETLLDEDPAASVEALLTALRGGASPVELASAVSFAAATRIARFPTSNEFGDWDTALHTFTFANAVEQGLRRSPSPELVRGVFDAAMSVYLDRFLNVPAAKVPGRAPAGDGAILDDLERLLDRQQQVDEAAVLVAAHVDSSAAYEPLLARLAKLLLREDRDFHTIQSLEASFPQVERLGPGEDARLVLLAAARYLGAHAPTVRAQGQTFEIARRLHRGERLYEDA